VLQILFWLLLLVLRASSFAESESRQVLPSTIVPLHYDLTISPDAQTLKFKGTVKITAEATTSTREIVLNAKGLTFDRVMLDGAVAESVSTDEKLGRATLQFLKSFGVGQHELAISYHGPILQGTFGFFAMDYDSPAGKRRTLATNFEPAGARMLLPCWDEPARKAIFTVRVDAPKDRVAVSNMPIAEVTALDDRYQRVQFATSPKMSTYLLFLSVGDYERVHRSVDGTDIGIVVKHDDLPKAAYALEQAAALLHYYNSYFGFRYPLPKLDLIAAPGNIAGGSMENWGSIFCTQNHLLFDPNTSTEADRQLVFSGVSHEMAHQWFGDLVTMAWWDDLWLNEGFATWMQTHAADALHPEWRTGLKAEMIFDRGKRADAKPSTHPVLQPINSAEQADQAFDEITYNKGAAVITMLEAYIGPDTFREGLDRYIQAHAYGNTVDSDLWGEMQAGTGKPILDVERDFTQQAGLPLIQVTGQGTSTDLRISRFYEDPTSAPPLTQSWRMPVAFAVPGQAVQMLLLKGDAVIGDPTPVVNTGGRGYARVSYAPDQVQVLLSRVAEMPPADQLNLLNDAWALGQSGYASAGHLLGYMCHLPSSADPIVWNRAVDLLVDIDRAHAATPQRPAFRRFALTMLEPIALRVGSSASAGEDPAVTSLRNEIWQAQARLGDPHALIRARDVYASRGGSPDERRTALAIVAHDADAAAFEALLSQARATTDPLERSHLLLALAGVVDPKLIARLVGVALSADAPSGTAPSLLAAAAVDNPDTVWAALSLHFDDASLPIDDLDRAWLIPWIAGGSSQLDRVADIRRYADQHLPADARQEVDAAVASIRLNIRLRELAIPQIDDWVVLGNPDAMPAACSFPDRH
jgi:aminopeptidase N